MAVTKKSMEEELFLSDVPNEFFCPITLQVMREPVIAADGHSYEKEAIKAWLTQHKTSPKTGLVLEDIKLIPNIALRQVIESYTTKLLELKRAYLQRRSSFREVTGQSSTSSSTQSMVTLGIPAAPGLLPLFNMGQTDGAVLQHDQIQVFLNHVAAGQQDEAEALLKQNRNLALASGIVKDLSNRTFQGITALQYAVWALDWHMWEMLLKYIPKEAARTQAEKFKTGTWVATHGEHAERVIQNLIDVLNGYDDYQCNSFSEDNKDKKLWIKSVGGAQLLLPMHVIHEYCNKDRSFKPCPTFRESTLSRTTKLDDGTFDCSGFLQATLSLEQLAAEIDSLVTLGDDDFIHSKLGSVYGLLRGGRKSAYCCTFDYAIVYAKGKENASVLDHNALVKLLEVRIQQRADLVAKLQANHVRNKKCLP